MFIVVSVMSASRYPKQKSVVNPVWHAYARARPVNRLTSVSSAATGRLQHVLAGELPLQSVQTPGHLIQAFQTRDDLVPLIAGHGRQT
jgi:hypothetical protein